MKESEVFSVEIQSLVYEGYGLGRLPDGKAVFVPFVLPGEKAQIRIAEEKQRFAIAQLVAVEAVSPLRIVPRCLHFGICGGCHYQHVSYESQLEFKKKILLEQYQRIGKMAPQQMGTVVPSTEEWAYRNAIQFQLNPEGHLCFNDIYNELFMVQACHLPMQAIGQIWPHVDFEAGVNVQRLEFRQNPQAEVLIGMLGDPKSVPELETDLAVSIVHMGGDALVLAGDDHLMMRVGDRDFRVSAASFFQTNFSTAEKMGTRVREIVRSHDCRTILDVFCGVGLFSALLADDVDKIVGIESSPSACADYAFNLDACDHVVLYQGKAEDVLPALDLHPDCAILDPPRAGLKKAVTQALLHLQPHVVLYVSCNPATLARDSRHLVNGGYLLAETVLVDMFPQTYHIESINIFIRE